MKKLMFAAALVASAAAFADPINAVSFEGYGLGETFANGKIETNEHGSGAFFCFTGGESNSSVVTNETVSTDKHTDYFSQAQNAQYLALDTEGGTFWRSINNIITTTGEGEGATTTYSLGTARAVPSTGTYLDTLVQFTVTEDEAPTLGAEDKLAIWLQADNGTTNLMVAAGYFDSSDAFVSNKVFALKGVVIQPGEWYRLTVAAIDNIFTDADEAGYRIAAFTIRIDGTVMTTDNEMTVHADAYSGWIKDYLSAEMQGKVEGGSVFLSRIQGETDDQTGAFLPNTLQGVGFQGTGAVDEIVWTEEDPFPAAVVEFTLTYSGDANTTLGAVTYTIDGGAAQTPTEGKIPDGASVSIAAPTFASGYQLAALTVDGTPVASPAFPYTFTMAADTTVAITSAQITYTLTLPTVEHATPAVTVNGSPASGNTFPVGTEVVVTWTAESGYQITAGATQNITMNSDVTATAPTVEAVASYPTYVGDDAALKTQYDTWKTTYGADSESAYEKQFLLNTDPSTTVADDALQIDSITENATAGWDIVVSTTVTGAVLSDGSKTTYNGYLLVKAADTLAGLATATPVAYPVTAVTGGKVSITVTSGKFMKVELTTTAPAQN